MGEDIFGAGVAQHNGVPAAEVGQQEIFAEVVARIDEAVSADGCTREAGKRGEICCYTNNCAT